MASVFPFNQIEIDDSVVIGPDAFIYGSGEFVMAGEDSFETTADGLIHHYRAAMTPTASAEVRGHRRDFDTAYPADEQPWPAKSGKIKISHVAERGGAATKIAEFDGIVGGEYDSMTNKTTLNITGSE